MRLRPLEPRDAEPMLAWMHDPETVGLLKTDFLSKTRADCEAFIAAARNEGTSLHRAVADDADRYLGTVSLKGIDRERGTAEFAITIGKEGQGTGAAAYAMRETLKTAFEKLGLHTVYWYVNRENRRAIRFYEKQGYTPTDSRSAEAPDDTPDDPRMVWFAVREGAKGGDGSHWHPAREGTNRNRPLWYPELSAIVPVHNTEAYLSRCLDSILGQTYRDYELILVDDGSTDRSAEICEHFAEQDARIRVIHEEARGAAFAREAGLKAAGGAYITFPDSDDWLEPAMFAEMMKAVKEHGADCAAAGFTQEGTERQPRGNSIPSGLYDMTDPEAEGARFFTEKMLYSGVFYEPGIIPSLWSKVFRRELLPEGGAPDPLIRMGDDAARSYPALGRARKIIVMNETRKYHYRFLPGSLSNTYDPQYFDRADRLIRGLNRDAEEIPPIRAGLPYYALFILEMGIDQYCFHRRRDTRAEKEAVLQKAYSIWETVRPEKKPDWRGFPADKARKCQLLTGGETGKLISLYAKEHFSATIRAVLRTGRTE